MNASHLAAAAVLALLVVVAMGLTADLSAHQPLTAEETSR